MRKFFFLCFFLLATGLALNAQTNFKKNALTAAIVVSDEAKALHFYRDILGMQEAGGFVIDSVFAKNLGLSKGKSFKVALLSFLDTPESSQLKIVSFTEVLKQEAAAVYDAVQEQFGLQYLTLQVHSLDPIMARAKKEGVQPQAATPLKLDDHVYLVLLRDPDGTFVEVIGDYSG